ncbi:MAG: DNA mismatch repair protein MutS [Bacillota bacterium]
MMKQYQEIKSRYPDAIVFFRLGDFYEMFFEDALLASRELDIVLTAREASGERAPMCGVPYHSAEQYIALLIEKGHKVAICEQLEDPKLAKGLVKRDVVRVITPGTFVPSTEVGSRYLAALCEAEGSVGLSFMDPADGKLSTMQVPGEIGWPDVVDRLVVRRPAECIVTAGSPVENLLAQVTASHGSWRPTVTRVTGLTIREAERLLLDHFKVASLRGYGCNGMPAAIVAAGMLLRYLYNTQRADARQVSSLSTELPGDYLKIDAASWRNLDIVEPSGPDKNAPTLFSVLDLTLTRMGRRLLREWLEKPLRDVGRIRYRHDAVEELVIKGSLRRKLRAELGNMPDLPRLVARVASNLETPRDLLAIGKCLELVPKVRSLMSQGQSQALRDLFEQLEPMEELARTILQAIREDPPAHLKDGGVIKEGFNGELDKLRQMSANAREYIAALEVREREATGIKSLKVGYNRVFGYYIEVTNPNLHLVPARFQRKQTLAGAERFITDELKQLEEQILSAEDKMVELEALIYGQLKSQVMENLQPIQRIAGALAVADVLCALAEVAVQNNYCRPEVKQQPGICISNGRHPVIEKALGPGKFVPNDVALDPQNVRLLVVTGPNMGGKSTFLRQIALIVIMAQMGSFVPASAAQIGVVDKVFARIGARDDLASGQSTFMVEMTEVANILNNATSSSLVLLDELGRGTGTFDGMSLAWAIAEHLHDQIQCMTLMATHFRELIEMARCLEAAANMHVAVKEDEQGIKFLWKVMPGGATASYGVEVAKLAGIPSCVTQRAAEILAKLEAESPARTAGQGRKKQTMSSSSQLRLAL